MAGIGWEVNSQEFSVKNHFIEATVVFDGIENSSIARFFKDII